MKTDTALRNKHQKPSPNIVVIGGGTGSFTLLSRLKLYTPNVAALVSMFDSGGSTGQLRDEYGVLPPGDVRQCLVALSDAPKIRDLFNFRFGKGSVEGHSFGNLFLTAVEKMTDDFGGAVDLAGQILNITGQVVPVTLQKAELIIRDGDQEVVGEHAIESASFAHRPEVLLRPTVSANPQAIDVIAQADIVVIAPGSLYESLVSNFLVEGIAEALKDTPAKVVQVVNLVTKPGQTDGWTVCDFVQEIERFAGKGTIDYALYNTQPPTSTMLSHYARDGEFPVSYVPDQMLDKHYQVVGLPLLHLHAVPTDPHDRLAVERTLIRHDADRVARELMRIYFS
jgi:uncharacterized cofD-like protein